MDSTRAQKLKPDPFFTRDAVERIQTGGFDADLDRIAQADWIIEAVIEDAAAKRALLERVDAAAAAGSIVSSNTSGLSIAGLAEGRSADFRRHWLGTHFFNPPRYLPLLEIIPTADTDPAVVAAVSEFADRRLGKNVVIAKDTPGFIANHVAMHGLVRIFEALAERKIHRRRDRRDHRAGNRPSEERDVPHGRHRGARYPRARRRRSCGAAAGRPRRGNSSFPRSSGR